MVIADNWLPTCLGDMNGRTGRKTGDPVVGNFGDDIINDNGERLIELCKPNAIKGLEWVF